ncbi:MAG: glycine cleavage system aminomethyltransferase GcvT [Pseudomonadota bacterium]
MGQRTPLYQNHLDAGAKIVDFGGWDMPLNYGSQIDEHHSVRNEAGMFDVSHMTVVDVLGQEARPFLRLLLANDVARLRVSGAALYSCMLTDTGGVVDDLIVYFRSDNDYRLIVNAATREKDIAWIQKHAQDFAVDVVERPELAMLAVQGPRAREYCEPFLPAELNAASLNPFFAGSDDEFFVARTGYTGEDGYEIVASAPAIQALWTSLAEAGVRPCGLGARDSLRLEAGLNLYGSDMDESTHPYESNLAWTISLDDEERQFIGRSALAAIKQEGVARKLVGLVLSGRGVLRSHQSVTTDAGEGETLSGGFSPTLKQSIALARVPFSAGSEVSVDIRGKAVAARIVKPPFVRKGKSTLK